MSADSLITFNAGSSGVKIGLIFENGCTTAGPSVAPGEG